MRLWRYICHERNRVSNLFSNGILANFLNLLSQPHLIYVYLFYFCRFCDRHGPNKGLNKGNAPTDLMCVAEAMMPRIILRLIQHLRENFKNGSPDAYKGGIQDADAFITMLLDFNNMGGLMRRVITSALTNPQVNIFPLNST